MEEYESAKEVFEAGQKQADDAAFKTWIRKCNAELEGESKPSDMFPEILVAPLFFRHQQS